MTERKMLPVGIEFFDELLRQNFYYVDKTEMIAELLRSWGKVNLFTRPRRFGKSLNMSMLKSFFEIGCDRTSFDGLKISGEEELCEKYMGQFPVISISLKGVEGTNFEAACATLKSVVGKEAMRFPFLLESERLSDSEKALYDQLIQIGGKDQDVYVMSDETLLQSLKTLSELLAKHYGKEVVLLIDEYDVPLDKAFQYGYYDQMVSLVRGLFGNALKTNPCLFFAVLTGCLRISKESVFTGLNNLKTLTITDVRFARYFGFTDAEVKEMLEYYELAKHYDTIKEWYDGYQFGRVGVYCPWDVICYCDKLCADPEALPEDFWSNTSGNNMVRRFIDKANGRTKEEIERLIAGEEVIKEIYQELTYSELDKSIEHLWSVLFVTGYLTQHGAAGEDKYRLVIPNREIRKLFVRQIREWFQDAAEKDTPKLDALCDAFPAEDVDTIEELFGDYLWNTISIRDTAVRKEQKENFYHGILLGLLGHKESWLIKSNAGSGIGYSDILVEIPKNRVGLVIEMKYAEDGDMNAACMEALGQIEDRQYTARLKEDGMRTVIKYGIACHKKECKVAKETHPVNGAHPPVSDNPRA